MFKAEELHPGADRLFYAQLLAAVQNGPVRKSSSKVLWKASDFMNATPWPLPQLAAKPRSLQSQVDAINSRLDP